MLLVALSEYILRTTVAAVRRSAFFGLVIDLSADRASNENMLLYVVYWDDIRCKAVLHYLCCIRLLRKGADTIFSQLTVLCQSLGLDMKHHLVTFCADGDSTMQGWRNGLTGRLRKYCDHVITTHCAAHRHVLAVQDVAGSSDILKSLDKILTAVHALFNRKSTRKAVWELFAREHGVTAFTFPLFVKTRWFSRAVCVQRLVTNFPVLVRYLYVSTREFCSLFWDAAAPVLQMLTAAQNVYMLHAFADILQPLEQSRKIFETTGCPLSKIRGEVTVLKERLMQLSKSTDMAVSDFGGKNVAKLMSASDNFKVKQGHITLKWPEHSWRITLKTTDFEASITKELHTVCTSIITTVRRFHSETTHD
jgi:Domain of unknown function (DUF4371)